MIAIGAIFRNEYDYILEWIAWHQIAGFKKFFIADNGSNDGTVALLEAFEDMGMIKLLYQPIVAKHVQLLAYERLVQYAIAVDITAMLFIDADEFLVHDSMIDGIEFESLDALLSEPAVAMVGINWRTFGSSGHKVQTSEPVVERFSKYCNNTKNSINTYLKSISKIALANVVRPHEGHFPEGFRRVDSVGNDLQDFMGDPIDSAVAVPYSVLLPKMVEGPLRINHYIIKSKQEFTDKKSKRGDVMFGFDKEKNESYLNQHDFNDATYIFPKSKLDRLKHEMTYLQTLLDRTVFVRRLRGFLDVSNSMEVRGWLIDEHKQSRGLKINIFVNSVWQGRVSCGFYRADLKEKKLSIKGFSGFRYTHPKPLSPGDVVEVKVHANRYVFPARSRVVIE